MPGGARGDHDFRHIGRTRMHMASSRRDAVPVDRCRRFRRLGAGGHSSNRPARWSAARRPSVGCGVRRPHRIVGGQRSPLARPAASGAIRGGARARRAALQRLRGNPACGGGDAARYPARSADRDCVDPRPDRGAYGSDGNAIQSTRGVPARAAVSRVPIGGVLHFRLHGPRSGGTIRARGGEP